MSSPECPDVETASEDYQRRFSGPVGAWFLDVQGRALQALLKDLPPGSRVLDVGGGHAQLTPFLLSAGFETFVLGSTPDALGRLEPFVRDGRVRFEVGAFDQLPFGDASFDAVVSVRLLSHLDGWRVFIAEACRVARRAVVMEYPSIRGLNRFAESTFSWKKRVERNTRPFALFHPNAVAAAFSESGYETRDSHAQYFWPMVVHRMHGSKAIGQNMERLALRLHLTSHWGSPILVRAEPLSTASGARRSPPGSLAR